MSALDLAELLATLDRFHAEVLRNERCLIAEEDIALTQAASTIRSLVEEGDEAREIALKAWPTPHGWCADERLSDLIREIISERDNERTRQNGMYPAAEANWRFMVNEARSQLQASQARVTELEGVLREIVDESAFNQQRFAEDDDTDYFLRCFKSVKDRARSALSASSGEGGR